MKFPAALLTCAALSAFAVPARAQTPAPMFPFVIPWDDAARGVATDVSFLNDGSAGAHGYVTARNGHFVLSKTGERIKFLGTNFVAKSAFPSHADAEKVAARVAKLGINLVRMHHMDNIDWGVGQNIWDDAYKDHRHLSAARLDKLDYLIAQLEKNGVYINLNLHVSRKFTPADGFPASVVKIPFGFDKRVDEFDRTMIARQKEYAHDLLTHVNPYTKLSYAADPAVAVVEINNENSLVGDPWATLGADLDTLPEPFRGELARFWNAWLLKKYGSDAKLKAAWLAGVMPSGPAMLTRETEWSYEHQGASRADFGPILEGEFHPKGVFNGPAPAEAPAIRCDVRAVDGVDWHVQAHVTGLDLKEGGAYTVRFRAKADQDRALPVAASLDQADWRNVGLTASAALTDQWRTYRYVFTVHGAVPNHVRIAFTLGAAAGTVWIGGLQIHAGAEGGGLESGQSLAAKNVAIPVSALPAQHDDWIAFLADTERAYANEMRSYLKNDLHIHANVICSQMGYGGLSSVGREAAMDFADNHAYWQHPSFPRKAWDSVDWTIGNTPMVADLAAGGGGTLRELAEYRVAGKPYSVSEYNHPAPSDFRAEMLPELAAFAALQDWDMIYLFDYGDYGAGVQNDKINSYFGIGSDPAKAAFLPAAAMIFRAGAFPPAPSEIVAPILAGNTNTPKVGDLWPDPIFTITMLRERLSIRPGAPLKRTEMVSVNAQSIAVSPAPSSDGGKVDGPDALLTAAAPMSQVFAGYVGGRTLRLGQIGGAGGAIKSNPFDGQLSAVKLAFPAFGDNFAAGTLTAMDRKPLSQSRRILLTLVGKVENQDMVWNADRTSVGNRWGRGPTIAEGVTATVTLQTNTARHVWALDGTGKRVAAVPSLYHDGMLKFNVGSEFQTLWYEIGE